MDLRDFNTKLAGFIKDAKLMEKANPDKAKALWLKIAEFALEFSKQPNIDRDFKLKLWRQIDVIIKKVKPTEIPKTQAPFVQPPKASYANPEDSTIDFDFNQFPSVPSDEESNSPQMPSIPQNKEISHKNLQDDFKNLPSQDESFYSKVLKMEQDLKQMPDFVKEVSAQPYKPDNSIIPFSRSVLTPPEIDDSNKINIKPSESSLDFGYETEDMHKDNIDPYKGTKDIENIKDPFSPDSADIPENNNIFCYACGAPVGPNAKRCPKCNAEL